MTVVTLRECAGREALSTADSADSVTLRDNTKRSATTRDVERRETSERLIPWDASGAVRPGHSEARDGPADGPLACAELGRDLVEGEATEVQTARALHLLVGETEPPPGAAPVEMGGDGGAVDAVRRCQRHHALSATMAFDEFLDLGGRQEGLSRPDLTYHLAVRAARWQLTTVPDIPEGPRAHA